MITMKPVWDGERKSILFLPQLEVRAQTYVGSPVSCTGGEQEEGVGLHSTGSHRDIMLHATEPSHRSAAYDKGVALPLVFGDLQVSPRVVGCTFPQGFSAGGARFFFSFLPPPAQKAFGRWKPVLPESRRTTADPGACCAGNALLLSAARLGARWKGRKRHAWQSVSETCVCRHAWPVANPPPCLCETDVGFSVLT